MKKIYLTVIALLIGSYSFCQVSNYGTDDFSSILEEFYTNYSDTIQDTNYLKTIKQFKRWEQFWGPRLTGYNSIDSITHKSFEANAKMQSSSNSNDHSNWVELGPNINGIQGIGRIDAIAIHHTNSNIIYAGSPSGGLWKTVDGGANWFNISDDYFTSLGVSSIAIDPANNNNIYAATGDVDTETTYSHGVYRSNDGGATWDEINTGLIDENTPHFTIGKVLLHPTDNSTAFLATSLGIYKCTNRNNSSPIWSKVYPSSGNEYVRNIGFKPGNPSVLYAVGIDIITSSNTGISWTRFATSSNGLDFGGTPWPNALSGLYVQVLNMAIDPNGNYVYVNGVIRENEPPYNWQSYVEYKLWRYDIVNDIWTIKSAYYFAPPPSTYKVPILTVGRNEMVVSPNDPTRLFAGAVSLFESVDGGTTWGFYNTGAHADYHEIKFDPNNVNTLLVGTDGGIWEKDLLNGTSTELNNGLGISTMYNMASSLIDPYQMLAGSQDCGNNYFKNNLWSHELTSDGFESYFDTEDIDVMYTTNYALGNGSIWRSTNNADNPSWSSLLNHTNDDGAWFGAALVAHPEKTYELYQARRDIWKVDNARTGIGDDWYRISDFSAYYPGFYGVNYALEIAPSDGNYIYTTYVNASSWVIDYNKVKLLKTSTGGSTWIDLTPDPYDGNFTYFITDIAVSDQNPNEVWVCYSGYMDDLKVKYYNGTNWVNYSEGLPNVPLNTIVYYKGSDDNLFVGTDIGVYYRDNSMNQWEPFTKDLPSVIVSWLEINYTNMTLRAATYGRGLWETDLLCGIKGEEVSIDNNAVWDTPKLMRNTLTVNPGAQLTITDEVSFTSFASIIVKPGAKLIIDGATLTNACNEPWQGIQVWGNKTAHQFPDAAGNYQQGYLELKNGAIIENAIVAVDLWNPDQWNTTGGMVYANGAIFRNNAKSVHALHYRNFNPYNTSQEMEYNSNFKNCTFEITAEYPVDVTFFKHVDLAYVNGIDFQACDFSLAEDVTGVSTYSHGIAGYDAKFRVSAICNSPQYPCPEVDYDKCTFTGFYNGVSAVNDGNSIVAFNVNRGIFNNNVYGVMTRDMNNATVLSSDFGIGHLWECGAGIYADNVTGFAFEENDFSKYPGGPVSNYFGIIINNSEAVNEVYKNNFLGLSYANFADGKNWVGEDRYQGLTYFCNENQNNYADFYVVDKLLNQSPHSGIGSFQGDDNHVAGNKFSQSGATWHFYNGGEHLVAYYYNQNNSIEIPELSKTHQVARVPKNLTNTCPSHYGGGSALKLVLTAQQKTEAELEFYDNLSDYNSVKTLYDSYVDGGSTPSEISDIQSAQPDDMWDLRAQLLGDSPHLSLEVLKEVADRTDVFTESALFDILAANPDELKKDTLISYLENKEEPLPEYMIDILKQLAEGVTYKTILQQQMSYYKQNYSRAANEIIRSILNDSVINYTELRNWLDNLGGITSDRQIISAYLSEGNYTDALNLANMLPQLYSLQGDELTEHGFYMDMLNLHQTLNQQGRNTFQLTTSEKSSIEFVAEKSKGIAGAQAKSIMEAVYNVYYTDCPEADGVAGYKQSSVVNPNELGKAYGLNITVKPNPANQWAAFDYTLPGDQTTGIITITDVTGHTVDVLNVTGQQGQKLWDTRNLKSGVYIYTLTTGGFNQSGKIVVSK